MTPVCFHTFSKGSSTFHVQVCEGFNQNDKILIESLSSQKLWEVGENPGEIKLGD